MTTTVATDNNKPQKTHRDLRLAIKVASLAAHRFISIRWLTANAAKI